MWPHWATHHAPGHSLGVSGALAGDVLSITPIQSMVYVPRAAICFYGAPSSLLFRIHATNSILSPFPTPLTSPLPVQHDELHQLAVALLAKHNIDLLPCKAALTALDFMPDILPEVPLKCLVDVTSAVKGKVMKLQQFAKEWVSRQEEKCRASM